MSFQNVTYVSRDQNNQKQERISHNKVNSRENLEYDISYISQINQQQKTPSKSISRISNFFQEVSDTEKIEDLNISDQDITQAIQNDQIYCTSHPNKKVIQHNQTSIGKIPAFKKQQKKILQQMCSQLRLIGGKNHTNPRSWWQNIINIVIINIESYRKQQTDQFLNKLEKAKGVKNRVLDCFDKNIKILKDNFSLQIDKINEIFVQVEKQLHEKKLNITSEINQKLIQNINYIDELKYKITRHHGDMEKYQCDIEKNYENIIKEMEINPFNNIIAQYNQKLLVFENFINQLKVNQYTEFEVQAINSQQFSKLKQFLDQNIFKIMHKTSSFIQPGEDNQYVLKTQNSPIQSQNIDFQRFADDDSNEQIIQVSQLNSGYSDISCSEIIMGNEPTAIKEKDSSRDIYFYPPEKDMIVSKVQNKREGSINKSQCISPGVKNNIQSPNNIEQIKQKLNTYKQQQSIHLHPQSQLQYNKQQLQIQQYIINKENVSDNTRNLANTDPTHMQALKMRNASDVMKGKNFQRNLYQNHKQNSQNADFKIKMNNFSVQQQFMQKPVDK